MPDEEVQTVAERLPEEHWGRDLDFAEVENLDSEATANLLSKFPNQTQQILAHLSAEKLIGQSIRLPKEDATDDEKAEAMSQIFTKLGRPESAEGYKVNLPEGLPKEILPSDEAMKEFLGWAHSQGFSQAQVDQAIAYDAARTIKRMEAAKETKEAADKHQKDTEEAGFNKSLAPLKEELGDQYDEYVKTAMKAKDTLAADPVAYVKFWRQQYLNNLAEDTLVRAGLSAKANQNDSLAYSSMD